jgi:hypothetical protein
VSNLGLGLDTAAIRWWHNKPLGSLIHYGEYCPLLVELHEESEEANETKPLLIIF